MWDHEGLKLHPRRLRRTMFRTRKRPTTRTTTWLWCGRCRQSSLKIQFLYKKKKKKKFSARANYYTLTGMTTSYERICYVKNKIKNGIFRLRWTFKNIHGVLEIAFYLKTLARAHTHTNTHTLTLHTHSSINFEQRAN